MMSKKQYQVHTALKEDLKAYFRSENHVTPSELLKILTGGVIMRFCTKCAEKISKVPDIGFGKIGPDIYHGQAKCRLCGEAVAARDRPVYYATMSPNGRGLFFACCHSKYARGSEANPEELEVVAEELKRLVPGRSEVRNHQGGFTFA